MAEKRGRIRKTTGSQGARMMQTKFGQKEIKTSRKGQRSCVMAVASILLLLWMLAASFISKGNVGILAGLLGLFVIFLSVNGIIMGIRGFREREKSYTSCKVGITLNMLVILTMLSIYVKGVTLG